MAGRRWRIVLPRREIPVPDWLVDDKDLDEIGVLGLRDALEEDPVSLLEAFLGVPNDAPAGSTNKALAAAVRLIDTSTWVGSRCKSCHAPVLFVPNVNSGRRMILDGHPEQRIRLDGLGSAELVTVYSDHHATCPDAAAWRGRSRKNPPPSDVDHGRRGD